jgi:hypothetical protein
MIRQQQPLNSDTGAWTVQVWVAFIVALATTSVGIFFLDADIWVRAFLFLGLYFTVSSTMSLSKALRDRHESEKLTSKLDEAQTERVLREVFKEAA